MTEQLNYARLVGRISGDPVEACLPSGDPVVSFRLVVRRSSRARRHSQITVDTFDCSVWTAALRRRVLHWSDGDEVTIEGELRRTFRRGPAGPSSRVQIDVLKIFR